MHEASLVRALLRQVEDLMQQHQARRVRCVRVIVGEFSGVEADLLETAFEDQVGDSAARGARLEVSRRPLRGRCGGCGWEFAIVKFRFECPRCASRDIKAIAGEELLLDSVTLEADS